MTAETSAPHIVMLVGNDIRNDSRVRKSAVSAARAGARVTLLGLSINAGPEDSDLAGVHLMRVATPHVFVKGVAARRKRLRRSRRLTGYASIAEQRVARLRAELTLVDAERARADGHAIRVKWLHLLARWRRLVMLVRPAGQRRLDRLQRFGWHGVDGMVNRTTALARWRRVLPELHDYEVALGPVIDDLQPDLIHAHDVHLLPTAARAAARARAQGRQVPVVYDAHEYVAGMARYGPRTPRVLAGWTQLEREFVDTADAIITVSPQIADALQRRYHLAQRPAVVLNTPLAGAADVTCETDVRTAAGVGDDVPLLVYSGGITAARGVSDIVAALTHLPGVHLVVVAVPHTRTQPAEQLREQADAAGVGDRLHLVNPVTSDAVVPFLATADVGVHSLLRYPNHDMALPNKLFEYLHAGLPLVVSDVPTMAEFVRDRRVGAVHTAGDPVDLARAVREVLDSRDAFAAAASDPALPVEFSWERQEREQHAVYARLLGERIRPSDALAPFPPLVEQPYRVDRGGRRLLGIGPANMAGQGWAWAKAVERSYAEVDTEVFAVERAALNFPADLLIKADDYANSTRWQLRWSQHVRTEVTHLLMEAGRPALGRLNGTTFAADVESLRTAGVEVGLIFHGSEIRNPRTHAQRYPWSPFRDPKEELTARLQRQVEDLAPLVSAFDGPKFYSTPDLLDDVPDGIWLPVVVDPDVWTPGEEPLHRARPLVVHAPSRRALKGTDLIEPVLAGLVDRGLIEYRRIENVPHHEVASVIQSADIVLDHFGIGNYGVVTCEAMATGRVSISHIHDRVRGRVPDPIPTIEATPDSLATVIEKVLDDRDAAREIAAEGPGFVRRWHDGRQSAAALAPFLGMPVRDGD
jgi:glycosyltransferase involved in cell wall biosynthesis